MSIMNPGRMIWASYMNSIDLNPPTLNTLHELIDIKGGVNLIAVDLIQTNTPTNAADIDVLITKDGTPYLYDGSVSGAMGNNAMYSIYAPVEDLISSPGIVLQAADTGALGYSINMFAHYGGGTPERLNPMKGNEIKVEIRQTSALDVAARIRAKATYERLEVG